MNAVEYAKKISRRYRSLKNGSIQIQGRIRIGSGARIGSDAMIGSGAIIGDDARIGYGAMIGSGARIIKTPLCIQGSRHPIYLNNIGKIGIGCEIFPLDYWLENYEKIGDAEGYNKEQISEYKIYLDMIANNRDMVFSCFGENKNG